MHGRLRPGVRGTASPILSQEAGAPRAHKGEQIRAPEFSITAKSSRA
jgi:hypothetical protein